MLRLVCYFFCFLYLPIHLIVNFSGTYCFPVVRLFLFCLSFLSVFLYLCMSVLPYLSPVCLSVSLSLSLYLCLSVCLSVSLSCSLSPHTLFVIHTSLSLSMVNCLGGCCVQFYYQSLLLDTQTSLKWNCFQVELITS